MRVLVCGGRDYENAEWLHQFMDELAQCITIDAVIDGKARGAVVAELKARSQDTELLVALHRWKCKTRLSAISISKHPRRSRIRPRAYGMPGRLIEGAAA